MPALSPLALLAYLLIFVGLVGSLLPVVPGPVFIWLGALLWATKMAFKPSGGPLCFFWDS